MAKTLTIAGTNFKPQYITNSARISEAIRNNSNVLTLDISVKSGQNVPEEGSEIIFKDGSRFLFGGFITRVDPVEHGEGDFFIYTVEGSDYSWIFNNKRVRKAYDNATLKSIVENILDTYLDSGYGFDTTNVQVGPTIDSITFDHITVRKAFEKLSKLTGYVWYVDYEKNLYFQEKQEQAAPEQITDTSANFSNIAIEYDISQVRNRVIVIGSDDGEQSATSRTDTFTGDGERRSWELEEKPSQIVSVEVDGTPQQYSLILNERDTDDFVYDFNTKQIRQTDNESTLTNGASLEVEYYPRIPIIVQRSDSTSITFFANLDGGDGVYEYTLKESSITSKQSAFERADQELEEYADPLVNGRFSTRTGLLSGGIFSPGQYLTVNLPTWGINVDTPFLIQEVVITMIEDEDNTTTEYFYEVRFGGRIVDLSSFLSSLVQEGQEVQDVEEIKTVFVAEREIMEMADGTPTIAKFTPPFEWGAGGSPQMVWSKSEWS